MFGMYTKKDVEKLVRRLREEYSAVLKEQQAAAEAIKAENRALADEYNVKLGVSKAQEQAMSAGSMFGWAVPAAAPKNYDESGQPIRPKHKDRGDAR